MKMSAPQPALCLRSVSMTFVGQRALDHVDLELAAGEVRALVGQNGSGKSTLIKIIAGYHRPDQGSSGEIHGKPMSFGGPGHAFHAGLRFIHQDLGLVDRLTVIDNLALGRPYQSRWWFSASREARRANTLLESFGLSIDSRRLVSDLSPAEQAIVAIVRALMDSEHLETAPVLVLDEATARLPANEVHRLFAAIRELCGRGGTVLYVTHRLDEVFAIADRVSVLRDGRLVATRPTGDLNHDGLVELIVGRPLDEVYPALPRVGEREVLLVSEIRGGAVAGVSFSVRSGEVLGVAGLDGSGRESLSYLLFGARPLEGGSVTVAGRRLYRITPRGALRTGLVVVTSDRVRESAIPTLTLAENITLPRPTRGRLQWTSRRADSRDALEWMLKLDVRPQNPSEAFATLSGGNQQKAVLARCLRCDPEVLVLDEPVQGVDVEAKAALFRELSTSAGRGVGIVLCSVDAEDLANVCDRVLVLRRGRVAAELGGDALTAEAIVRASLGNEQAVEQAVPA